MARWWTKVRGEAEKHTSKLDAGIRLNFAVNVEGIPLSETGLYKRNPEKYPDEPNCIRAEIEKAHARAKKLNRK